MVIEHRWWKLTLQNPPNTHVNGSGYRTFEFPSPDEEGAQWLVEHYFQSGFPGYEKGTTKKEFVEVTEA